MSKHTCRCMHCGSKAPNRDKIDVLIKTVDKTKAIIIVENEEAERILHDVHEASDLLRESIL